MTFHFESWVFVDNLTASNRTRVLRLLLQTFNLHIVDMSKAGLEQFVKATSRLLERGYTHQAPRIHMDPPLLQELLFGAYVCMYNGFQVGKSLNNYYLFYFVKSLTVTRNKPAGLFLEFEMSVLR